MNGEHIPSSIEINTFPLTYDGRMLYSLEELEEYLGKQKLGSLEVEAKVTEILARPTTHGVSRRGFLKFLGGGAGIVMGKFGTIVQGAGRLIEEGLIDDLLGKLTKGDELNSFIGGFGGYHSIPNDDGVLFMRILHRGRLGDRFRNHLRFSLTGASKSGLLKSINPASYDINKYEHVITIAMSGANYKPSSRESDLQRKFSTLLKQSPVANQMLWDAQWSDNKTDIIAQAQTNLIKLCSTNPNSPLSSLGEIGKMKKIVYFMEKYGQIVKNYEKRCSVIEQTMNELKKSIHLWKREHHCQSHSNAIIEDNMKRIRELENEKKTLENHIKSLQNSLQNEAEIKIPDSIPLSTILQAGKTLYDMHKLLENF